MPEEPHQKVNIYIETSIRPMRREDGCTIYVLETESPKWTATITKGIHQHGLTQNGTTLEALQEAIERITCPCEITLYTDCTYLISALNNDWLSKWEANGWKNSKGEPICDVATWQELAPELHKHRIRAMPAKGNPYQDWMKSEARKGRTDANQDLFTTNGKNSFSWKHSSTGTAF